MSVARQLLPLICALVVSGPTWANMDFASQLMSSQRFEVRKTKKPEPIKKAENAPVAAPRAPSSEEAQPVPAALDPGPVPTAAPEVPAVVAPEVPSEPSARMGLELRTGFVGNHSASNYTYRDYNSSFSFIHLGAELRLDPRWTMGGFMTYSLGASMSGDPATRSMDSVKDDESGLMVRYSGADDVDSVVDYEILYLDHGIAVSPDSVSHPKMTSGGFGVGGRYVMRASQDRRWILRTHLFPRLQHAEGETSINVRSGSSNDSSRLQMELASEHRYNRKNDVILGLSVVGERYRFQGPATLPDSSGITPSNVTVTNGYLKFFFGYRWSR